MVTKERDKVPVLSPEIAERGSRLVREVEEAAGKGNGRWAKVQRALDAVMNALLWGTVKPEPGCLRCGTPMFLAREEVNNEDLWVLQGLRHWECPLCSATSNQRFVRSTAEQG